MLMIRQALIAVLVGSCTSWAQTVLHTSDNVPKIVASKPPGTTFVFTSGTYRLQQPIVPKDNDKFIGETPCAPPVTACAAIISGARVIGPDAKPDGSDYAVSKQTQQNSRGVTTRNCDQGWFSCILPEDLFFDNKPYRHLDTDSRPHIGEEEWWFDYGNHTIYFHDDPSGHTVETSITNNAFGGPANNVTIQYLTIEKFSSMYPVAAIGTPQGPRALTQGANWTIEKCEVRFSHGAGVRVGYRIHILHNYLHDNGQFGVGGGIGSNDPATEAANSRILIEGNTIEHNNYAHFDPGFGAGGVKVGATSGVTVKDNIIRNNEGAGIHFDDDSNYEVADGNTITDNTDADGLVQEIGQGTSIFRNNVVLRNGARVNGNNNTYQIAIRASSGVEVYCNVIDVPPGRGVGGWGVMASNRGSGHYPPFPYHAASGNSVHHNTVIWEPGAFGEVGFRQGDTANQPNFFENNAAPDYNSYHVPRTSEPHFVYDNDSSKTNRSKPFSNHQRSRADVHSSVDSNISSGFPRVAVTAPADQSTVSGPVTISASASDNSGIRKVEFYVDWALEGTSPSPPYEFNWNNGTTGPHIVAAMAYSNAGIHTCYAVTVNKQ
jgi:parallel beta-helix repeat protein